MTASTLPRCLAATLMLGVAALLPTMVTAQTSGMDGDAAGVAGQSPQAATKDLQSRPDPVEQARLETREQAPFGRYLTDQDGMSLYLFEKDERHGQNSLCDQTCAIAWPPYASKQPPEAGKHVDADKLGTITREDGTRQVTYAGWPLYYFSGDKAAGDALGQDVIHLGAEWYLLSPDGEKIEQGERKNPSP
ncbi:COG4315 family predicted lipoprotein [Halomonas cerina]|uniref:Putative lipoprotein with Yx(FWY)xxD motif n=1 Tax=Halomonas cerina TaxID=447424 RepID=A0A839VF48_9GAMM|nr:hypothetical protein [Halomonas cerina]MBB3191989.1 putative lipoprotein with Yx(FWY)xxD motif [Halomonas cerina]